jgi:hypothetical protein
MTPYLHYQEISMRKHEDWRSIVPLKDAKAEIRDSDLLLFRGNGLIAVAGRGPYTHAGMAAWWGDDLFCLDIRELKGGRAVMLAREVERHPGRIDVFEANPSERWPEYDRTGAVRFMRRLTGCDYGWYHLLRAGLLHLPFVRLFTRPETDDSAIGNRPPFCSQAISMASRIGGNVDPVENLADRLTEPCDLARSPFYRYRFTLGSENSVP